MTTKQFYRELARRSWLCLLSHLSTPVLAAEPAKAVLKMVDLISRPADRRPNRGFNSPDRGHDLKRNDCPMHIDLIGDFRLDLDDPDEHGMRHGVAKMPGRTDTPVKAGARKEGDIIIAIKGVDDYFFVRHWVDVAPTVKRVLER